MKFSAAGVGDAVQSEIPSPRISSARIRVEAEDDELSLRVDDFAGVLRTLFDSAVGEFTFAIFGHWGRGKTFLMRRLAHQRNEDDGRRTIFFSAWKYPTAPEVWVHLYETIAEAANRDSPILTLPRHFRAGLLRHGYWPLVTILVTLAIGIVPFWMDQGAVRFVLPLVGVFGAAYLTKLFFGFRKRGRQLFHQYLLQPRHGDKLGLQAVVGKDLGALLGGWILPAHFDRAHLRGVAGKWWAGALLCVVAVSAVALALTPNPHEPRLVNLPFFGLVPLTLPAWVPIQLRTAWLLVATFAAICLLTVGFHRGKLLLVVDDLDRCEPLQMVAVIESLKVLLEIPAIHERLQVVFLVEEEVLRLAVENKYRLLVREDAACGAGLSPERIWRETTEKLFTAFLRLPALSEQDVRELMAGYTSVYRRREEREHDAREVKKDLDLVQADLRRSESLAYGLPGSKPDPAILSRRARLVERYHQIRRGIGAPWGPSGTRTEAFDSSKVFDPEDELALQEAAKLLVSNKSVPCGPRSLRNFLFRYQLAKLILERLDVPFSCNELAASLAVAALTADTAKALPTDLLASVDPRLAEIVRQVSPTGRSSP